MEDQQPDPGDLTTDPERADDADTAVSTDDVAAAPPARRRFWPFGRRRPVAADAVEEAATQPDPVEAPQPSRRPTGKRTRRAAVVPPVAESDPTAEEVEGDAVAGAGDAVATPSLSGPDAEAGQPEADDAGTGDVDTGGAETDTEGESAETEPEPILVPHRPAGRRLIVAASVAAALFVGASAFAGAQVQPYLADRAAVDTKLDIARTAAEAITTLWTYTPDDMEMLPERSSRFLAGDFAEQYRRYIDAIVATNKQAQVTNSTEVMGTAVEALGPTEATALVYTNSVSTSPVSKNIPSLRYQSYRLTLERRDAHWLITRMNAVTNLDLSPQI